MLPDDEQDESSALDDLRHTARAICMLAGFALNDVLGHGWQAPDEDGDEWEAPDDGGLAEDATPDEED